MHINLHIDFAYDVNDANLAGFGVLLDLVDALHKLGVEPSVSVKGVDPPPTNVVPRVRKGSGGNGTATKAAGPIPRASKPETDDPVLDVGGIDDPDADPLDQELNEGGLSPVEALDRGLTLVRQIYNAGHKKEVKAIQQEFNVAKFADVPVSRGHAFFTRVTQLAEKTGIQV